MVLSFYNWEAFLNFQTYLKEARITFMVTLGIEDVFPRRTKVAFSIGSIEEYKVLLELAKQVDEDVKGYVI